MRFAARSVFGIASLALALASSGCALERIGGDSSDAPPSTPARPGQPGAATQPDMAGRWTLSSANGGTCLMTFGGAPNAAEGTIAPEGGCPGAFFTSRKWTFEKTGLVMRNHNSEPLAQLSEASPSRFDGQAVNGERITLARVNPSGMQAPYPSQ